jgi:hypothetical protein
MMLGTTIGGWRVIAAAYKQGDPAKPVIALLEDTTGERNHIYAVAELTADGKGFANREEAPGYGNDDGLAWEEFAERTA